MKTVLYCLALLCSLSAAAQENPHIPKLFVRVYDLQGHKMAKGNILSIADASLELAGNPEPVRIPLSEIGLIKTKHSAGNNMLFGAVIGGTFSAIAVAASADPDNIFLAYSAGEGALAGMLIGAPVGGLIGGITALFKNSQTFGVDGDPLKWEAFREAMRGPGLPTADNR